MKIISDFNRGLICISILISALFCFIIALVLKAQNQPPAIYFGFAGTILGAVGCLIGSHGKKLKLVSWAGMSVFTILFILGIIHKFF